MFQCNIVQFDISHEERPQRDVHVEFLTVYITVTVFRHVEIGYFKFEWECKVYRPYFNVISGALGNLFAYKVGCPSLYGRYIKQYHQQPE